MRSKVSSLLLAFSFLLAPQMLLAQATAKLKNHSFDTQPFRGDLDSVPKGYRGHDAHALAAALLRRPVKNDYETTPQYKERVDAWASRPLYGNVRNDDLIALSGYFFSFDTEYNADTQTMEFSFNAERQVSAEDYSKPYIIIDRDTKALTSVLGQTAMGVKFKYERKAYIEFGAKLLSVSHAQKYVFEVPPIVAKGNILWKALYIGTLADPYIFSEESYHAPTLSERYEQLVKSRGIVLDLEEILVYETSSGKILARVPVR